MSGAGFKASIPSSVRKTIQNIKEITGNHSDEDIYAMLKECSMDPNETTQKLLLQDTFHEVKRKKDRKKENLNNREPVELRRRHGTQGRGQRGVVGNFMPHNVSHGASISKYSGTGKDTGAHQVTEKVAPSLPASQETISKAKTSAASSAANDPASVASGTISGVSPSPSFSGSGNRTSPSSGANNNLGSALLSDCSNKSATVASRSGFRPSSSDHPGPAPASSSAVNFSSSDPTLVPSNDLRHPSSVGAVRCEEGNPCPPVELTAASETGSSSVQGKIPGKSEGVAKTHRTEMSPSSTVTHGSSTASRPSSNYGSRSQHSIGAQKAGSNKEWKPKITNTINQGSEPDSASAEVTGQLQSASSALGSQEDTSKLQKKLEDLNLTQRQHVILPNHIFVPDSEKNKFSFGSLGVTFGVNTSYTNGPESEKSSTPLSQTSQSIEETAEEQPSSSQNAAVNSEVGDYPDHPQSPTNGPENLLSSGVDGSSSAIQEFNESKQDTALQSEDHPYSEVHTSPNYGYGFVPPVLGNQVTPFDSSETQTRDISRLPSFVVHQPFDPASYYAQFYRSGADSDGCLSPFSSAAKYNGNVTVLAATNSQSPQEGGLLSTAGPTPLVTQAAGLMQSSIAVTQQPVPVFRTPSGVHISHYAPNYIPYGHYFSPFYVPPPPAMHQFVGNGAFPQQPQASTVYPPPPAVAAPGVKYPLPQFKPGTNAANPTHLVMPSAYGAYGSSPAGYNHSSAAPPAGNSTFNEDLGSSQFKENNVYISGQQSEGSAVWVTAPGRDISSLPTSSYYNIPPQGQHVTFAPTQAGHGTFTGIYHPPQAVTAAGVHPLLHQSQTMAGAVEMVGPGGNVYQQPQHAQINWPGNY
ncbi:PREDICTED: GBF-interacting protein 1-like isoform X1 [Lupinus angustifolius]|uniref:GBF-interacting protein 1-like isoform X1 n=1 Tax=Lupinus angustifolius TaxID=3871 RepID=UPI00092F82F4|nr:PREDICTED: GBF-interacting protein 1-like isoform X1 [Lupinus angustifolius]XP_019455668.1 PREDICTED: GBF-interacting protein 1-like isoform X1 [Lupinus angustifolius]